MVWTTTTESSAIKSVARLLQQSVDDSRGGSTIPFTTIAWLACVFFAILIFVAIFTSNKCGTWGGTITEEQPSEGETGKKTTTIDSTVFDDARMTLNAADFCPIAQDEFSAPTAPYHSGGDPTSDRPPEQALPLVDDEEMGLRSVNADAPGQDDTNVTSVTEDSDDPKERMGNNTSITTTVDETQEESSKVVVIPIQRGTRSGGMMVPNLCAICLSPYEVGQTLVWSPLLLNAKQGKDDSSCSHAYHEKCIMQVLERDTKCPLCRQDFVVLQGESSGHQNDEHEQRDDFEVSG